MIRPDDQLCLRFPAQANVEIIREELLADWRGNESAESAK
jgi:hypothetical protein